MTKQLPPAISSPRDRPENEAGVPHIEVTPEMIRAGLDVFLGEYPDTGAGDRLDRDMIAAIFKAMMRASWLSRRAPRRRSFGPARRPVRDRDQDCLSRDEVATLAKTPKTKEAPEGDPKRGDEILKRMLQSKPKPHDEMVKERKKAKRPAKR